MKKLLVLASFFVLSCSSFKNISNKIYLTKNSKIIVTPLINNSESPLSGLKAKNIIENELISKKLTIYPFETFTEGDSLTEKDLKDIFESLRNKDVEYVFYGYVNEWRYKAGIDSEPAVSLTINLYDLKNNKIIWSGSASETKSSYKSVGIVSQKVIKKILSTINVR